MEYVQSMNVTLIKTSGEETQAQAVGIEEIHGLAGADVMDVVNLRDGRVMFVDDLGHPKALPVNAKATELYHSVCRPGTTWEIRGDVVIALERDFSDGDD
jgi:hypothetical protein